MSADFKTDLPNRLRSHLTQVARVRDPYLATAGHFFVREYVRSQLAQWGEVTVQRFGTPPQRQRSAAARCTR